MRYFLFVILALLFSCQKDASLDNVCADPLGSQDIVMKNGNVICFKEKFNACFVVRMTATTTTITAIDYTSIYPGTMIGKIADVGLVRCLGDVKTKPSTFFFGVNLVLNHGYVALLPDNTYGRLYVDSWVKPPTGAVSEVHLTWQYSFQP